MSKQKNNQKYVESMFDMEGAFDTRESDAFMAEKEKSKNRYLNNRNRKKKSKKDYEDEYYN